MSESSNFQSVWSGHGPRSVQRVEGTIQPPPVELGDVVRWHDDVNAPPSAAAIVTWVGTDQVNLAVILPGYRNFEVKEGVRHKDHPDRAMIDMAAVGCWSHRPSHQKLFPLLYEESGETPAP